MNVRPAGQVSVTTKATTFQVTILKDTSETLLQDAVNAALAAAGEQTLHAMAYDTVFDGTDIVYSVMLVLTR